MIMSCMIIGGQTKVRVSAIAIDYHQRSCAAWPELKWKSEDKIPQSSVHLNDFTEQNCWGLGPTMLPLDRH